MTALATFYSQQFRKNLVYHPVWEPGSPVAPGDFGRIEDEVFVYEGNVSALAQVPAPVLRETAVPKPLRFSVGASFSVDAAAEAQLDPSIKVGGSLAFSGNGGVVFSAADLVLQRIDNLDAVLRKLPWKSADWDIRVFVAEVQCARRAGLLLVQGQSAKIGLSGKLSALKVLDLGDASVGFGSTGAASYSTQLRPGPSPHPVALRLYGTRRGWLGGKGRPEPLAVAPERDEEEAPFVELSPRAPLLAPRPPA